MEIKLPYSIGDTVFAVTPTYCETDYDICKTFKTHPDKCPYHLDEFGENWETVDKCSRCHSEIMKIQVLAVNIHITNKTNAPKISINGYDDVDVDFFTSREAAEAELVKRRSEFRLAHKGEER